MTITRLNAFAKRFDALQKRERILVVGIGFVGLYMVFNLFGFDPAQKEIHTHTETIATQKTRLNSVKMEQQLFTKVLANDPSAHLNNELEALHVHLSLLDRNIVKLSAGLVPAQQLPVMLQEVLTLTDAVQLQQIRTLPPERINLYPSDSANAATPRTKTSEDAANLDIQLYRQGVNLVLQGSYFQLLEYVKRLENTPWRFYWESLAYRVTQYPLAQVELQIYTLSVNSPVDTAVEVPVGKPNENN